MHCRMSGPSLRGLVGWLALCYGAAVLGGLATPGEWYESLSRPSWTPPNAVFGPVWTVLYGMMALAAWLVWKEKGFTGARVALTLFAVQLALNVGWSWIFFGLRSPGAAFAEIVLLWGAIALTMVAFWRIHRAAAILLAPYLAWVGFAAVLNFEIWRLNA